MSPSRDPNVPHPGRIFYNGRWETPEGVERRRVYKRRYIATEKGRALQRQYNSTEKSRACRRRYNSTIHGQTVAMLASIRYEAKRRKGAA